MVLVLLLVGVACTPPVPAAPTTLASSTPTRALTPVTILHAPTTNPSPLFVAANKGYFRESGLAVDISTVTAGQDAVVVVGTNKADGIYAGYSAGLFNAISRNVTIRIATGSGVGADGAEDFVVRKVLTDSGQVKSAAGLKGRKVGISGGVGTALSYYIADIFGGAGLTLADIEIVNIGGPEIVTAMESGAIDGVFAGQPALAALLGPGRGSQLGPDYRANDVGLMVGERLIRTERATGVRVVAGLLKAVRTDLQGEYWKNAEVSAIIAKHSGVNPRAIQAGGTWAYDRDLAVPVDDLQRMQEVFLKIPGTLVYDRAVPPSDLADLNLITEAKKLLGD